MGVEEETKAVKKCQVGFTVSWVRAFRMWVIGLYLLSTAPTLAIHKLKQSLSHRRLALQLSSRSNWRGREKVLVGCRKSAKMSASLPGNRDPPASRHDLSTYWGRVKHSAEIADPR